MSARALLLIPLFLPLACTQASGETQGGSDDASESDATTAGSGSDTGDGTTGEVDSDTGAEFPAPAPEGCVDDASAGHHQYTCGELVFDVEVPEACMHEACGLVVDVHGFSMSAAMEDASTELQRLGRERGYVVVQPNANPAPPLSSWNASGGDDPEVFAMLERALRVWHLDEDRVHFTGFSQGGGMTWRMLCAHADVFASVAPAALAEGCAFTDSDRPSREVPVLYMHGTQDLLVPFSGAEELMAQVRDAWQLDDGALIAGDDEFERTRFLTPTGTPFEWLTHDYAIAEVCLVLELGGHCFPGSSDPGTVPNQPCSFACPQAAPFHWGTEVMDFFAAHPRQ
ncbi:MAG: hypothetical protein KC636_11135 [Myxococcales bacterium]|nr:hypothetical protein [Myxococcales bacterium]